MTTAKESIENAYWTQVEKTPAEHHAIKVSLIDKFAENLTATGTRRTIAGPVDFSQHENLPAKYKKPLVFNIDGYAYSREPLPTALPKFFKILELEGISGWKIHKEPHRFSFMWQGVLVHIYHVAELEECKLRGTDSGMHHVFRGYGGLDRVMEILMKQFSMSISKVGILYKDTIYKNEVVKTWYLTASVENMCRYLGLATRGYKHTIYSTFKSIKDLAEYLATSKYLGKSSFFINADNEYVGPAEHLEIPLFAQLVTVFKTGRVAMRDEPESSPDTIHKGQMKFWTDNYGDAVYKAMTDFNEALIRKDMLEMKVSDDLIKEISGPKTEGQMIKFRKEFEDFVSAKTDYEFFVLSSSEESVKAKLLEFSSK